MGIVEKLMRSESIFPNWDKRLSKEFNHKFGETNSKLVKKDYLCFTRPIHKVWEPERFLFFVKLNIYFKIRGMKRSGNYDFVHLKKHSTKSFFEASYYNFINDSK